jgi:sec-independent protein translocase protein TatB
MFNLDPGKLLVIAVVAIILLGPDKLPQVARQAGNAWRSFTEFRHRMESEVRNTMPDLPPTSEIARLARSPSALLNHLSSMADSDESAEESHGSASGKDGTAETGSTNSGANGAGGGGAVSSGSNGAGEPPDGSFQPPVLDGGAADVTLPGPGSVPASQPSARPLGAAPGSPPVEPITPGDPTLN